MSVLIFKPTHGDLSKKYERAHMYFTGNATLHYEYAHIMKTKPASETANLKTTQKKSPRREQKNNDAKGFRR